MIWRFKKSAIDVFLVLMLQFFRPKHSVDFSGQTIFRHTIIFRGDCAAFFMFQNFTKEIYYE